MFRRKGNDLPAMPHDASGGDRDTAPIPAAGKLAKACSISNSL